MNAAGDGASGRGGSCAGSTSHMTNIVCDKEDLSYLYTASRL